MRSKNMWILAILLVILFLPLTLLAQVERWVYTYNGPGNSSGRANTIIYGPDGNIYAAGYNYSSGTEYFTVISLTSAGDTNWVYRYNGPGNGYDEAHSIVYGSDGNIYAAGASIGSGTNWDFTVISLTASGTERWVYRYNGPGNDYDIAHSIVYGSDGNIYTAGYSTGSGTSADFTVISLTASGTERWVYRYNGPDNSYDEAYSVTYGLDGNIYAAGLSDGDVTYYDFTVISLTTAGTERWVYRYIGPANYNDIAYSIVYGSDGNIYAAGESCASAATYWDFTVISLTTSGTERWVYTYNGPGNDYDEAYSIVYGSDGNIYAAGYSTESNYDFTVISLTTSGTERWVYTYNGPGNDWGDEAYSIVYGSDGNIYAAGISYDSVTNEDFTVISLTASGTERWIYRYNGPGNDYDQAYSIVYGSDGNIYAAGGTVGIGFDYFTVISLGPLGINEGDISDSYGHNRILFVPSFFMDNIRIKFTVPNQHPLRIALYNIFGGRVYEKTYAQTGSFIILGDERIRRLSSGIYILSVSVGTENVERFRLIKL